MPDEPSDEFKAALNDLRMDALLACKNVLSDPTTPSRERRETAALVWEVTGDLQPKRTGPPSKTNYNQFNFPAALEGHTEGIKALFQETTNEDQNVSVESSEEHPE